MTMIFDNTNDLVSSFRNGNQHAFDKVFTKYYQAVYFFAHKLVKDEMVAEDIVIDSFVKLWQKRQQLVNEAGLRSYVYKIVYHASLKWLQRQKTEKKIQKQYILLHPQIDDQYLENVISAETLRLVIEGINELPSECRKVFVKLYVEGKSVNETAQELNVAVSTVKNQKARGIKMLKGKLT